MPDAFPSKHEFDTTLGELINAGYRLIADGDGRSYVVTSFDEDERDDAAVSIRKITRFIDVQTYFGTRRGSTRYRPLSLSEHAQVARAIIAHADALTQIDNGAGIVARSLDRVHHFDAEDA